jgi:pyruvate,water dikinase
MVYDEGGSKAVRNVVVPEVLRRQFVLSPAETVELANQAIAIEKHYSERAGERRPMDIEWAKDGASGELFIVQARPETAHSQRDVAKIVTFRL